MSAPSRTLFLFLAAWSLCVLPGASDAREACQTFADSWARTDGVLSATGITMACRGFRATAIRAEFQDGAVISLSGEVRVETAEWLLDAQSLTFADGDDVEAVEGCLTLGGATGLQVCGQNLGRSEGSWTVTEAVLSLPGGGSMNAESAQCDNNGCEISGATVPVAIALPYPVGEVDTMGRSRGFLPTRLGFRTDRGAFARQDWYQPLSQAVALKIGVNGATVGAIGIGGELSWYRPAHQPSSFELNLLHDSSGPDENRLVLDADLSWSSSRDAFGLALQGTIHSDGSLGRDLGHDTIARLRADRHVSGDLWAGFGTDRLWIASHGRRTISTTGDTPVFRRLADDTVLSPALVYRGALPNLGYSHQATIGRAVHLLNTLRFDRWVVLDSGPVRPLSEARVLGGGQLRVLTFPGFSFIPGVWIDFSGRFDEPDAGDPFRQYASHLLTTAELSSSWVGGGQPVWHFIEVLARFRYESFRNSDTVGPRPRSDFVSPATSPLALEVALEQEVRGRHFSLEFPFWWSVRGETNELTQRLAHATRLALSYESARVEIEQRLQVDLGDSSICCWDGSLAVSFGRPEAPLQVDLKTGVWLWEANHSAASAYRVSAMPQLRRTPTTPLQGDLDVLTASAGFHISPVGLETTFAWPLGFNESPDIGGEIWFGELAGFRLTAQVSYLSDETLITFVTLAHDGFDE